MKEEKKIDLPQPGEVIGGGKEKKENARKASSAGGIVAILAVALFIVMTVIAPSARLMVTVTAVLALILMMTSKSRDDIIDEIKTRLLKYEGKQLGTMDQAVIAFSLLLTAGAHRLARLIAVFFLLFLLIIWLNFGTVIMALLFILLLLLVVYAVVRYLLKNIRVIEARPPHLGLVTILGERHNIVLKEGYALRAPPIIDFIPINVEKVNQDFKIEDVYSKGNVLIELKGVSLVYSPDPERLMEYINIGGRKGVEDTTEDLIPDILRIWAKKFSVEELLGSKKEAIQEVIKRLTGSDSIEELRNGLPDTHLMGIKIYRFTIGPVKPAGEYGKEIEKRELEKLERDFEVYETETELEQAELLWKKFQEAGEEVSFERCLRLIKDYKIQREGRPVIPGLGDLLSSGVSLLEILKILRGGEKE